MSIPPANIAVIIVNYGTADLAVEAVESVPSRKHGGRIAEVHLVDNKSPDDSAQRLTDIHKAKNWGDRVTLYLEDENHGFGRGNNIVLEALAQRETPPQFVILLNPDAKLENEALSLLARKLEEDPKIAFAGAGSSKPDGTEVTAAFRFPNILAQFGHALAFGPVSKLLKNKQIALPPSNEAQQVDWLSGATLMSPFAALRDVGFFDPDFFLYYEEVELMHRAHRKGWKAWYVPEARVIHEEGAATGVKSNVAQRKARPAYWYGSWRMYHTKMHGRLGALAFALAWFLGALGNTLISFVRRKSPAAPLHFYRDFTRFVLIPIVTRKG